MGKRTCPEINQASDPSRRYSGEVRRQATAWAAEGTSEDAGLPGPDRKEAMAGPGAAARALGILTVVDGDVMACYCAAVEQLELATKALTAEGYTRVGAAPSTSIRTCGSGKAAAAVETFGRQLGLTPHSRPAGSTKSPMTRRRIRSMPSSSKSRLRRESRFSENPAKYTYGCYRGSRGGAGRKSGGVSRCHADHRPTSRIEPSRKCRGLQGQLEGMTASGNA